MKSVKGLLTSALTKGFFPHTRRSYAQSGEDIIISDLFSRLGITHPSYLDIGANEPVALNNTYRLYLRGSRGVLVEPNPVLYKKLLKKRKKDICINAGVAFDHQTEAVYYIFPEKFHGLNTFSKGDAEFWEQTGTAALGKHKIEKKMIMQLLPVNEIIQDHFSPYPNLISIDVEGLDMSILRSIDFERFKPEVFCVETLDFGPGKSEIKNVETKEFFKSKGYFIYADTYINTIFCREDAYPDHG
jgi:FkbM family methyltransferase